MIPLQWFWLIAVALLAACVGSFLNVVIYRLTHDLSVARPARSFCPGCGTTIAWYDNLPIASYLALRGRCRHCGMAIAPRYPFVEGITVLLFLLMYDACFLGPTRAGFASMGSDWPVFLAHLVLVAALVATSAIDIDGYWIDVSITYIVFVVGIGAHTFWTPETSMDFPRPWAGTAAFSVGAGVGLVASILIWGRREPIEDELLAPPEEPVRTARKRPPKRPPSTAVAWLIGLLILAWLAMVAIDAGRVGEIESFGVRAAAVVTACFLVLVIVGMSPTEADVEIVEAIDDEGPLARREALGELVWLAPAIILGVGATLLVANFDSFSNGWHAAMGWAPFGGSWRPVLGLTTALSGFVVAGAIGWGVRILFTLALGKEAFGMGDVHLMAAAGAVAGWTVVVIGFFMACPLAVLAVILWLVRKRSRAVWFGPWLSLGIVIAMVFYAPIAERFAMMYEVFGAAFGGLGP